MVTITKIILVEGIENIYNEVNLTYPDYLSHLQANNENNILKI